MKKYYVTDELGVSCDLEEVLLKLNKKIIISLEEYKELLMIKGKYEELKSQQTITPWPPTKITFTGDKEQKFEYPYKWTCQDD